MLTIANLDYSVEARPLFEGASAQISSGWKVGLVGRDGWQRTQRDGGNHYWSWRIYEPPSEKSAVGVVAAE